MMCWAILRTHGAVTFVFMVLHYLTGFYHLAVSRTVPRIAIIVL